MMDLRELETHYLIEQGLINIQNPFFSTMREVQSYSIDRAGGLCPFALSFYIVPLINAAIRVGEQEDKVLLFESMLDFKGWELIPSTKRGCKGQKELRAEQACRVCSSLKRLQTKQIDTMLPLIEQNISLENKIIVIEVPSSVNPNLRGLIANQLMAKYQQPVLMLSERVAEDGTRCLEGSGRGYEMRGFNDLRTFIEDSGYAYLASGHANAFGVGMTRENLDKFIEFSNAALANIKFSQCVKVDFIWGDYDFSAQDIIDIAKLNAVWGQGMPEPQIALENVEVYPENVTLMSRNKNPTLKITLKNGVSLIKFKSSEEEYEQLISSPNGVTITAIGTCALNEWNGRTSAQIKIKDYEIGCPILFRF